MDVILDFLLNFTLWERQILKKSYFFNFIEFWKKLPGTTEGLAHRLLDFVDYLTNLPQFQFTNNEIRYKYIFRKLV